MALNARDKISRRSWLLAGLTAPLFRARAARSLLAVTSDGDNLHVAAPEFHFLTGKPLARLHGGNTVVFVSKLSLFRDPHGEEFRHAVERWTISYDVWEENFQVALAVDRRTSGRLSLAGAESWCLENLAISALGIEPSRPFWLRFDVRTASEKKLSSVLGGPGISMRALVEFFGKKPEAGETQWTFPVGPLRLAELPRTVARRSRNG